MVPSDQTSKILREIRSQQNITHETMSKIGKAHQQIIETKKNSYYI